MCKNIKHEHRITSSRAYKEAKEACAIPEHNPMFGKTLSEESSIKNKGNKYQLGMKRSDELKQHQSIAKIGEKNPMFGKKQSPETIEKMKTARKFYWENKRTHSDI